MNKRDLLRIAGFLAGLIIIISILDIPFRGGIWYTRGYLADRDARIAGIQEETEGQIDVLNVGDSLADVALTPVELYRDYGITSYVMGRDLQKCIETYYAIRLAKKEQPIKVVLWEVHNLCKHMGGFEPYMSSVSEFTKYKSQFIKYHYIWKKWIEGKSIRKYFKGYVVNEAVTPYNGADPHLDPSVKDAFEIPRDQKYVFDKIYNLCEKENIKLVLYCVPSPHCYDTRMHNGYAELAKEYHLDFLDGNEDFDRIGIDVEKDYFDDDGDHLNLFGTRKMTKYLGQYLSENCGLTDHRNDPDYSSWEEILPLYEQEVIDMEGTGYPIIEEKIKKEKEASRHSN